MIQLGELLASVRHLSSLFTQMLLPYSQLEVNQWNPLLVWVR